MGEDERAKALAEVADPGRVGVHSVLQTEDMAKVHSAAKRRELQAHEAELNEIRKAYF